MTKNDSKKFCKRIWKIPSDQVLKWVSWLAYLQISGWITSETSEKEYLLRVWYPRISETLHFLLIIIWGEGKWSFGSGKRGGDEELESVLRVNEGHELQFMKRIASFSERKKEMSFQEN